jgi:hypothetical protein
MITMWTTIGRPETCSVDIMLGFYQHNRPAKSPILFVLPCHQNARMASRIELERSGRHRYLDGPESGEVNAAVTES